MPLLCRWDRRRPTYHDVEVAELDTSLSDGGEPLVSEARGRRSHRGNQVVAVEE